MGGGFTMRLLWLPEVLRAAGLTVVEVAGWKIRGSDEYGPIRGLIYHATADKARTGEGDRLDDAGAIAVIRDGRPGLAGPIAAGYINRQGVWSVIASGRCNTVKTGWAGPLNGLGNTSIVGFEAENDNTGEAWPSEQLDSLRRGFAAILLRLDLPVAKLAGHKEHQPGDKTDPYGINMADFRAQVARTMAGEDDDMLTADEIAEAVWRKQLTRQGGDPPAEAGTLLANGFGRTVSAQYAVLAMKPVLDLVASKVDIDPAELAAIEAAAREGTESAAGGLVAAVVAAIQQRTSLSPADLDAVEQAVRAAFAGGLAPDRV